MCKNKNFQDISPLENQECFDKKKLLPFPDFVMEMTVTEKKTHFKVLNRPEVYKSRQNTT